MREITKKIILFFIIIISFSACKDDKVEADPLLEAKESILNFETKTAMKSVGVNTNLTNWEVASTEPDWCKVTKKTSPTSHIVVMVTENLGTESRSAEVILTGQNLRSTIKVEQIGSEPSIRLAPDSLYLESKAFERVVKLTTNIEEIAFEVEKESDWFSIIESDINKNEFIISIEENKNYTERISTVIFKSTDTNTKGVTKDFLITQKGLTGTSDDVDVPKDIKVIPTGGKANQAQPNQGIENTFNGIFGGEPYHSPWGDGTTFPVVLEYFFDGKGEAPDLIDYLIYYTRSGNGNFGKLNLYVATESEPEYKLYDNYDFKHTNSPSKINFTGGLKNPIKIKFEVLSGLGGYASCDQMEFYKVNKDNDLMTKLLSVFTDGTCSELKNGVTDEQINNLSPFFGNIASKMKQGNYPRDFRIDEYPAYSIVEDWADKLLINPRGVLDNCTGIYAEANEEVIILVGETNGNQLKLRSIEDANFSGDDYMLNEGINKIKVRKKGLLYILYNVNDIQAASAKPIKIHIPMQSGTVNGYWDMKKHKTDEKYKELLANATYPYFDVKGNDMMLKFITAGFRQHVPNSIIPTVKFWDEMVQVEQSIMGWDGIYPDKMNNRMYARSTKEGYMSAQSYQTNFAESTLFKILSPTEMLKDEDNPWGPAHEIGHMNQGAINWKGNTETSNNLFSNLVRYKMTEFLSRGETMEEINQRQVIEKKVFTDYGDNGGIPSLRMQWQLYCYFHILENNQQFFPKVFKISRENGRRPIENDPGWSQLNYVRNACDATELNLLEFFEFWGFLTPADMEVNQYGKGHLTVTPAMINETISYVQGKGYKKPAQVIQYIEDRDPTSYGEVGKLNNQYKSNTKISKNITYTRSGNSITIQNGDQAIGFEVRDDNELKFFSNKFSFNVNNIVWNDNLKVFAVQADGDRKELTSK